MGRAAPEVVCEGLRFPESPRWHEGALWFAEKRAGVVRRLDEQGRVTTAAEVPGQPGGIDWLPDGTLVVVSMGERRVLVYRSGGTGEPEELADLSRLTVGRCNDMVVDARGRAYVGHFGYDLLAGQAPAPASLVLVAPGEEPRAVADALEFPNGCVVTPDGHTLVVAETAANRLTAFDVLDDGSLGSRRLFADLGDAAPDGICLDAEGAVWAADPLHGQVVRVAERGSVLERVSTGDQGAFACALGGDGGRTLFVCTYSEEASMDPSGPPIGRVVALEVEVPAAAAPSP